MDEQMLALARVLDGWDGYQRSLVEAIQPLTAEQLAWRPGPEMRSVGELARHIALGRVTWFLRMDAPGSVDVAGEVDEWETDSDGNRHIVESAVAITEDAAQVVAWLEKTWQMVESTLAAWTVADLVEGYRHRWNGQVYLVSRQWTLWRILAHDLHHGGELSLMLGMQGVEAFALGGLGGHVTLPPLADESSG